MADALCDYILQDKHFLGICLGLQLLFESSEEKGNGKKDVTSMLLWLLVQMCIYFLILKIKAFAVEGLGLISGVVRKFESSEMVKVPHIGWNRLNIKRPSKHIGHYQ